MASSLDRPGLDFFATINGYLLYATITGIVYKDSNTKVETTSKREALSTNTS